MCIGQSSWNSLILSSYIYWLMLTFLRKWREPALVSKGFSRPLVHVSVETFNLRSCPLVWQHSMPCFNTRLAPFQLVINAMRLSSPKVWRKWRSINFVGNQLGKYGSSCVWLSYDFTFLKLWPHILLSLHFPLLETIKLFKQKVKVDSHKLSHFLLSLQYSIVCHLQISHREKTCQKPRMKTARWSVGWLIALFFLFVNHSHGHHPWSSLFFSVNCSDLGYYQLNSCFRVWKISFSWKL